MGYSDDEAELKKKKGKGKKHKDSDSEDERKDRKDREKEERKARMDREKEERKAKMDKEKEEWKAKMDKEKEDKDKEKERKKAKMDKDKEERKERADHEKEERKEKKKHKEEHKHHREDKKEKPPRPPSPDVGDYSRPVHCNEAATYYDPGGILSKPSQSGEVPWFLREPDAEPGHDQHPPRAEPSIPQSPPPQYSFNPSQQHSQAMGNVQNAPPSGYRLPLSPNVPFPTPDRLGPPPATDFDGLTPIFIGSAIFSDSVHPCKVVPSLNPPCRVLYGGNEVEHHGRYDVLPITQNMEWVPTKLGEIPPGRRPVEGGYESNGSKLYHALGSIQGAYAPGKAGQHLRGAIVHSRGGEHHLQESYSILCWR